MNTVKPTTAKEIGDLIEDLTKLYVVNPEAIIVATQESRDGSAYFALKGDPQDDSRLIGRDGCHINSLTFLVKQAGIEQDRDFGLRLITSPVRMHPWEAPRAEVSYDPAPALDIAVRWLGALGVEDFTVTVEPPEEETRQLTFNLTVKIKDRSVAEDLSETVERGQSVIGALGTLLRAVGKQNGVRIQLNLAP